MPTFTLPDCTISMPWKTLERSLRLNVQWELASVRRRSVVMVV